MTLGDIIKEYRNSNNLSMDAFSERSGISKAYISLLEKNKHPQTGKPIAPSIQCIKQAAEGMGMDFNILFSKIDGNVSLNDTPSNNSLTPKDERDIKKDLDAIMEKIEAGEDSPPLLQWGRSGQRIHGTAPGRDRHEPATPEDHQQRKI